MPKLTENVLIGGRVYLAGEDVSEADAKGVRSEVFAGKGGAPAAEEPQPEPQEENVASDEDGTAKEAPAAEEPAKASRARGKGASTK